MPGNAGAPHVIRFGVFEVDLRSGELRKTGLRIRLQEQPFQVLAMLLEHPGEVVTREELQQKLWSTDTFVDFEHGVNTAISKIREALGDSAENPRFVETLPRRGYRFIAPVDVGAGLVPALGYPQGEPLRRRGLLALASVAALALVVAAAWLWFQRARTTTPEGPLTAVPLTAYPGYEDSPSFSPDGTQVAFSWNGEKEDNFDIYVKLIGTDAPLRLTTNPAREFSPAWSPDGRWIAFCRDLPGDKYAVVLTSPIRGPERILTENNRELSGIDGPFLAWSPDSRWLAMVSADKPVELPALFLYSVETGEKRRLTSPAANVSWDSCPAFSPDGRTLAFVRWVAYWNSNIYLLGLSPGLKPVAQPKQLTHGSRRAASPSWATDGRSLVFSVWPNLWRVDASGTGTPQRLATIGADGANPAISRRGNRLAYVQGRGDINIWRIEIPSPRGEAKAPHKFISSTRGEHSPQFSPDGKKIAFISDRSGSDEIWVCDADSSNAAQLTSLGGPGIGGTPHWSPEGSRLTFESNLEGRPEVYVVNASGGSPRRVTSSPTFSNNPSWSRDGQSILFDSATPKPGIYKVPAEGGSAVLVTDKGGWVPIESPDGTFIYSITDKDTADGYSLRRVPTEGGEAHEVLMLHGSIIVDLAGFAVAGKGVYFIARRDPKSGYSIEFLNTTTRKIQRIASLEVPAGAGLTVSPDRRWILYAQLDQAGSDLMLVENFR